MFHRQLDKKTDTKALTMLHVLQVVFTNLLPELKHVTK